MNQTEIFSQYITMAKNLAEWNPEVSIRYLKTYAGLTDVEECIALLDVHLEFLPVLPVAIAAFSQEEIAALRILALCKQQELWRWEWALLELTWSIEKARAFLTRIQKQKIASSQTVHNRSYWSLISPVVGYLPLWQRINKTIWISRLPWAKVKRKWQHMAAIQVNWDWEDEELTDLINP